MIVRSICSAQEGSRVAEWSGAVDPGAAMKPTMPMSMISRHIAGRKSDMCIARDTQHGRDLIPGIRRRLNSPSHFLTHKHMLRVPRKVTSELRSEADRLTRRGPRLGCAYVVRTSEGSGDFPSVG
jgi:hypothetical protein